MTTDSQYSWPRFFMELADKLLAFRDDRQGLIATLKQVYAEIGMTLPTLDSGGVPMDIDPFTVYGLFNRGLTDAKRRVIALGLGGALGVQAPLRDVSSASPSCSISTRPSTTRCVGMMGISKGSGTYSRLPWPMRMNRVNRRRWNFVVPTTLFFNSVALAGTSRWDSSGSARMPTSTCARVIAGSSGLPDR